MDIIFNQQIKEVPEHCSVEQLLSLVCPGVPKGIAIALNRAVLPRLEWVNRVLQPQDEVLLITATQGG